MKSGSESSSIPEWAKKRQQAWRGAKKTAPSEKELKDQARAYRVRKAGLLGSVPDMREQSESEGYRFAAKPSRAIDNFERERGLMSLEREGQKVRDRLHEMRSERQQRMRSSLTRRAEKGDVPARERVRRINTLLRARAYDANALAKMPDTPQKTEMEAWLSSLTEGEQKRLYVIGRKKIEFKFNEKTFLKDYFKTHPNHEILDEDTEVEKNRKQKILDEAVEKEKQFQEEQKELADALEVTAIPMLRGVFQSLGKNVDVYLTSPNDDLAGGIDVAIDFLKPNGEPEFFPDGKPLRLMVDMTYARMWNKIDKEVDRGRVCDEAYTILKGNSESVPEELSNARAMKLFRTVVETLGGTMSTQTFDESGIMEIPQMHIPRLILGLDWASAFSSISNWVAKGDEFEEWFKKTGLARRIALSIQNQLVGLHRLAAQDSSNSNLQYLQTLVTHIDTGVLPKQPTIDQSLGNIDRLLTTDNTPLKSWQRNRVYHAALAQIKYGKVRAYARGDKVVREQISHSESQRRGRENVFEEKLEQAVTILRNALQMRNGGSPKYVDDIRAAATRAIVDMRRTLAERELSIYEDRIRHVFEEEGLMPPVILLKSEPDYVSRIGDALGAGEQEKPSQVPAFEPFPGGRLSEPDNTEDPRAWRPSDWDEKHPRGGVSRKSRGKRSEHSVVGTTSEVSTYDGISGSRDERIAKLKARIRELEIEEEIRVIRNKLEARLRK